MKPPWANCAYGSWALSFQLYVVDLVFCCCSALLPQPPPLEFSLLYPDLGNGKMSENFYRGKDPTTRISSIFSVTSRSTTN